MREAGEKYRFGYQGEFAEQDDETGWNAFELRMYDSKIGRWMAPDPYRQYWSPYMAMGNNPMSLVDPDGGMDDDCPICDSGADYVVGAIVENRLGSWQYLGNGDWNDLSHNPSVSSHNETGYLYNYDDLVIRFKLFTRLNSENIIVEELQRMEQRGEFIPLTRYGFYDHYVEQWGTNSSFWHAIEGGYFDTPAPGSPIDVFGASKSFTRRIRPTRLGKSTGGGPVRPKLSIKGLFKASPKNPWNAYLKATKGKYKGGNWLKKARQDYNKIFKGIK